MWVAETEVVLAQPARTVVVVGKGKKQNKKQVSIPGPPLTLRLIVVQVRHADGRVLAAWHLLTNAPVALLSAEQLARCYDFYCDGSRHRVECKVRSDQCKVQSGREANPILNTSQLSDV